MSIRVHIRHNESEITIHVDEETPPSPTDLVAAAVYAWEHTRPTPPVPKPPADQPIGFVLSQAHLPASELAEDR